MRLIASNFLWNDYHHQGCLVVMVTHVDDVGDDVDDEGDHFMLVYDDDS